MKTRHEKIFLAHLIQNAFAHSRHYTKIQNDIGGISDLHSN